MWKINVRKLLYITTIWYPLNRKIMYANIINARKWNYFPLKLSVHIRRMVLLCLLLWLSFGSHSEWGKNSFKWKNSTRFFTCQSIVGGRKCAPHLFLGPIHIPSSKSPVKRRWRTIGWVIALYFFLLLLLKRIHFECIQSKIIVPYRISGHLIAWSSQAPWKKRGRVSLTH